MSLLALARGALNGRTSLLTAVGVLGAGLFYGDAVITPAISVLSAVEGVRILTPDHDIYVVPITLGILFALFAVQRFGTAKVGHVFGPVMLIWFLSIGISGLVHISDGPEVLLAINPYYAFRFLSSEEEVAFVTIGAIFLAVTGAEALYADRGHFGRKPITLAWLFLVFPCLLLNYAGQGAFVLANEGRVGHPFFEMNRGWALLPVVLIATAATVIASQAVITGAFSLTRQAMQLNMLPRQRVIHTSETHPGQIYLPRVNLLLALVVALLVLGFAESEDLASAYGIAVTGNMVVTTVLLYVVVRKVWHWHRYYAFLLASFFFLIDSGFFLANVVKLFNGGWASLAIACVVVVLMWTWMRGSRQLFEKTRRSEIPLRLLANSLANKPPHLVDGTAVFLTGDPLSAPTALLHSLKHFKVLHQRNAVLSVITAEIPTVRRSDRVIIEEINPLFIVIRVTFGFKEQPNIPAALAALGTQRWKFDVFSTSFFLSRRSLTPSANSGMPQWQDRLFIVQIPRDVAP